MDKIAISNTSIAILVSLAAATAAGGFAYHAPSEVAELVHHDLVAQNVAMTDENGAVATRTTDLGSAQAALYTSDDASQIGNTGEVQTDTGTAATGTQVGVSSHAGTKFAVTSFNPENIVKATRAPSSRTSTYPYDDVPAPTESNPYPGFFVPATAAMPEPWKSLQSGVSAQNRKHGTVIGTEEHNGKMRNRYSYDAVCFAVAQYTQDGVLGAMVYRKK